MIKDVYGYPSGIIANFILWLQPAYTRTFRDMCGTVFVYTIKTVGNTNYIINVDAIRP